MRGRRLASWILLCSTLLALASMTPACGDAEGAASSSGGGGSSSGASASSSSGGGSSSGGVSCCDGGGEDAGATLDAARDSASAPPCTANPATVAQVEGYMTKLQFPPAAGALRTRVAEAIVRTCDVFSPDASNAAWKREYCYAHLVASISKESGYNPTVSVKDAYATRNVGGQMANDPTVGLLQVRFSSTVHEMAAYGNLRALTCAGCTLPAAVTSRASEPGNSPFWAVTGPTQHLSVMQDVSCNVAMGSWYYYVFATGNGKPATVTYPIDYCAGRGTAATLITGLRSHLEGAESARGAITSQGALNALQSTAPGPYRYITEIKGSFDAGLGAIAGTHPFFLLLNPDPMRYCK